MRKLIDKKVLYDMRYSKGTIIEHRAVAEEKIPYVGF